MKITIIVLAMILILCIFGVNHAQSEEEHPAPDVTELAKKTQNPVADLISIPFQFNFNSGGGLADGTFMILNWQPVIPFKLNEDWNMIARTIIPVVSIPGPDDLRFSGIADIQEQLFISPSKAGKLIWGVGPILSLPTATATPVQTGSWAAGPTFVALTMSGSLGHRRFD